MEGVIANFRQGRHTQKPKHMIVIVKGVESKEKAKKLIGKKIVWVSPSGKKIYGSIKATHGRNGAVRAIFDPGLPGQAIATKVSIED